MRSLVHKHRLFWDVGYYWDDVTRFLQDNLASPSPGLKNQLRLLNENNYNGLNELDRKR
jgi:hypothetical protein